MTTESTFQRWRLRMGIRSIAAAARELEISRSLAAELEQSDRKLKRHHRLAMAALAQGLPAWGSGSTESGFESG